MISITLFKGTENFGPLQNGRFHTVSVLFWQNCNFIILQGCLSWKLKLTYQVSYFHVQHETNKFPQSQPPSFSVYYSSCYTMTCIFLCFMNALPSHSFPVQNGTFFPCNCCCALSLMTKSK